MSMMAVERRYWPPPCYVASLVILCSVVFVLAAANPARAQEDAQQLVIEEIIVRAQLREQREQDVPISMSVMDQLRLKEQNINTIADVARIEPSLTFKKDLTPQSLNLSMRGVTSFTVGGGLQPVISLVVDGVPLGRAAEFNAELGDIERVEVLKGPQGTLFGKNATGGAISLVRAKPTQEFASYIETSYTTDNESLSRVMISGPLFSKRIRGRLDGYYTDRDGYVKNVFTGGREGGEKTWGIVGKLEVDISERLNLLLTGDFHDSKTSMLPTIPMIETFPERREAIGQAVLDDVFKTNSDKPNRSDAETGGIVAELNWDIGEVFNLVSITAHREFRTLFNSGDIDASPARGTNPMGVPAVHVGQTNFTDKNGQFFVQRYQSQELRLHFSTPSINLVTGVFYQDLRDTLEEDLSLLLRDDFITGAPPIGTYFALGQRPVPKVTLESMALFSDISWQILPSVEVFAGFRWTKERGEMDYSRRLVVQPAAEPFVTITDDEARFNPAFLDMAVLNEDVKFKAKEDVGEWAGRLGATWHFSDEINFYVSAARSFIGVGFNASNQAELDTAVLDPQIAESVEVGMKGFFFDRRLRVNAAVFRQTTENIQITRTQAEGFGLEALNAGTFDVTGLELSAAWNPIQHLTFDLNLSALDTEFSDLIDRCYFGQTEGEGCNIDTSGDGQPDSQDLKGKKAVQVPELAYNLSARYERQLFDLPWTGLAVLSYTWQDEIQFSLTHDPLTKQGSVGLLDATMGVSDLEGRYEISVFGKNLTDEKYFNSIWALPDFFGRRSVFPARGAKTYYGVKVRINF